MTHVHLAVVGAHLEGMPLHHPFDRAERALRQGVQNGGHLSALRDCQFHAARAPLVHALDGAAIALEVYELDLASFVAEVPAPLAIGTVTLDDGSSVKGFVAEPRALDGASDITALGG